MGEFGMHLFVSDHHFSDNFLFLVDRPQVRKNMNMAFDHKKLYYGRHWETRDGQTRHVTDLNREDALKFLVSVIIGLFWLNGGQL
jgi:hypothetical protein